MFPFAPLLLAMLVLPDPHPAPAPVDPLVARLIESHLEFLASDDRGGRETGTVQSLATGQYVAAQMRRRARAAAGEGGFPRSAEATACSARARARAHARPVRASRTSPTRCAATPAGFDLTAECVAATDSSPRSWAWTSTPASTSRALGGAQGRPKGRDGWPHAGGRARAPGRRAAEICAPPQSRQALAAQAKGALASWSSTTRPTPTRPMNEISGQRRAPVLSIPPTGDEAPRRGPRSASSPRPAARSSRRAART
jgi:hypothetical protein